jgi:hypothetical protein
MTQIPLSGEGIRHLLTFRCLCGHQKLAEVVTLVRKDEDAAVHISQVSWNRRRLAILAMLVGWGNPAVVFADQASDVAALEAKCEAEREAKIKPLRDLEIAKCKADQNNDPGYCERFWKDYGNSMRGANGGTIPRMFSDLPICVAAFKARKALADGDVR